MLNSSIYYILHNRLISVLLLSIIIIWGIITSPFGWETPFLPSDPVPVDAIPDLGENQQIVFTKWNGHSPQDVDDQITYPLTTYLLGIADVKSIRCSSMFGFSSIYIIFKDGVDFYDSRARIVEKLSSIPEGLLPIEVKPVLGPDATALGQIFWYTIEGRNQNGEVTGGWDLHEIRSVQDYYVKYGLTAAEGVAEVATIGGHVQEFQVDVNPAKMRVYKIPIQSVMRALQRGNSDVGAKTIELNQVEYFIRGLGYFESIEDIENTVVVSRNNVPIFVKDVANVSIGPANRRGILDKGGAEVVGGVIVARYGENPLQVIENVKLKIAEISSGLPQKTLANGEISQLQIIPFYDRSKLIHETLDTLEEALSLEILISIFVVITLIFNLRAAFLISGILPISVLIVFIAMRYFNVDANIVALSGIAIAIGTMVDLGIVLVENMLKHIKESKNELPLISIIYNGASEVSSAILTAVTTTIISFIPVFSLQAAEGKLFIPLAFTKTFALIAAVFVSLFILPPLAYWLFGFKKKSNLLTAIFNGLIILFGVFVMMQFSIVEGIILIALGTLHFIKDKIPNGLIKTESLTILISLFGISWLLTRYWMPLGFGKSIISNFIFVILILGAIIGSFWLLLRKYERILNWCLANKTKFLMIPISLMFLALNVWLGFNTVFSFVNTSFSKIGLDIGETSSWKSLQKTFPGIGKEFMPALDEGSFLLMPTSMPHSGVSYNHDVLRQLDMRVANIPEVETVVGKLGRVDSAIDPAPISMFENLINYKSEYLKTTDGNLARFKTANGNRFILQNGDSLTNDEILNQKISTDELIEDADGDFFRNWRTEIRSPDDIWQEIVAATKIPGVTSAPKLQPIETRLVMLQTGMRAPMGIKVYGADLQSIETFAFELERILKTVSGVNPAAVFADRMVGKPYLHLEIDRNRISQYGLAVEDVQNVIQMAIGGMVATEKISGRERYNVRIRYPRELRDSPEMIRKILVPTQNGNHIPLEQVVTISFERGPQSIKSENTFLVGYVLFDKQKEFAEVDVVNAAQQTITKEIESGNLVVPTGVSYKFSGSYENQIRAEKRLAFIIPVVLGVILLILYLQFSSLNTALMIFAGIFMAFSGGFLLIWCYGISWFGDFSFFQANFRALFNIETVNLSVAVWVGFIALFGIATDDGVLIATYLDQTFAVQKPKTVSEIRSAVVTAGQRRIRPAVMTTVTTLIALLPIFTSTGRGSDIMIPMAIPIFGGMIAATITYFIVPVLYCLHEENKLKKVKNV